MFKALSPGAIGVRADTLVEALAAAKTGGFGGVEFNPYEIADLIAAEGADTVRARFTDAGIKPGGMGAAGGLARFGRKLAGGTGRAAPAGGSGGSRRRDARLDLDHARLQ